MPHVVDFENVSTTGLDSSPVAEALAGPRANEACYFKYHPFHAPSPYGSLSASRVEQAAPSRLPSLHRPGLLPFRHAMPF
jgi:hypothetical protein